MKGQLTQSIKKLTQMLTHGNSIRIRKNTETLGK